MTTRLLLASVCLVLVVLSVPSPIGVAEASETGPAFGEMVWPRANQTRPDALGTLGARLFPTSNPIVIDAGPTSTRGIERLNDTTSRVTIRNESGGEVSFIQEHLAPRTPRGASADGAGPEFVQLPVRPQHLRPVVTVPSTGVPNFVVVAVGSSGDFNVDIANKTGHPEPLMAREVFQRLGWPTPGSSTDQRERWSQPGTSHDTRTVPLYLGGEKTCIEASGGRCTRQAQLVLDCNCTARVWLFHPDPGEELTDHVDGEITVSYRDNVATIVTDEEGRLVRVGVPVVLDLDPSAVLSPVVARDRIVEDVHARGYRIGGRLSSEQEVNVSHLDRVRFELEWVGAPGNLFNPRYVWDDFGVLDPPEEGSNDTYGDVFGARYVQDAVTGEILEASFEGDSPTIGDRALTFPGMVAVVAAVVVGAVVLWLLSLED